MSSESTIKSANIGYLAGIIGVIAYVPLLYNAIVNRTTQSLYYYWLFLALLSSSLWLYFGWQNSLTPTINHSTTVLIFLSILIGVKYYHESNGTARHMTSSINPLNVI